MDERGVDRGGPLHSTIVEPDSYLSWIDGLRGVAIGMVMLVHSSSYAARLPNGGVLNARSPDVGRYIAAGAHGVQLFFILSAFTLYASSHRRWQTDRLPARSFYIRRAFRILPLWWMAVAFWAILDGDAARPIAAQASFLFGFLRQDAGFDIVPGGWSLFVEETFYLFLPLLFLRVRTLANALRLLAATVLVAYLWYELAPHLVGASDKNTFIALFPLAQWPAFAVGIVCFFLVDGLGREFFTRPEVGRLLSMGAGVGLFVFVFVSETNLTPTLALGLLVLASVSPASVVGRLMRTRLLILLGRFCYSIYLVHFMVLRLLRGQIVDALHRLHLDGAPLEVRTLVVLAGLATVCLAIGAVSYNLFEMTFVRFGRRAVARLNGPAATPALGAS